MKRVSKIRIKYEGGTVADVTVKLDSNGKQLTRDEAKLQHDEAVDAVIASIRDIRFERVATFRNISVQ